MSSIKFPGHETAAPLPPPQQPERAALLGDELDAVAILAMLIEGRWLIVAATGLALAVGFWKANTATPIYRADSLVQVEDKGGQMEGLKELSEMFGTEAAASTEIELIRSRAVVGAVVDALQLDVDVRPRGSRFFGSGSDRAVIGKLRVPATFADASLVLVAGEKGRFTLQGPSGETLAEGVVGEETPAKSGEIEIAVASLIASPGTVFDVIRRPRMSAILGLRGALGVRESGRNTGIISLSLDGADPAQITRTLDGVMNAYVALNIERRAAEAQKTLDFINGQLPAQKALLEDAELKLHNYRRQTGKMDLSIEAQAIVSRLAEIDKAVSDLTLQRDVLRQHYTDTHPNVVALDKQLAQLGVQRRSVESSAKVLPETELQMVRLLRDASVANSLYVLLLNKAQELNLVKSGTVGNVRIVDVAVVSPGRVSPKKKRILVQSLLVGLFIGATLAVGRKKFLGRGVEDPDALEKAFGLPVFAGVPFSDKQKAMTEAASKEQPLTALARLDNTDLAIESIRSLRTSLQFALASARNNVIVIGGSRPGVGKSFVSVNLAHVVADTGKRVLLVDGDLRKGHLHRYFATKRDSGLSELISGSRTLEEAVRQTGVANLSFLSSGVAPPNPSELLASERFERVATALSEKFDLVIIDAPPILAVTDAVLLARAAGVNLLVVKSGLQTLREIGMSISRLQHSGVRINGFVFSAMPLRDRTYGQYRPPYQYDYR